MQLACALMAAHRRALAEFVRVALTPNAAHADMLWAWCWAQLLAFAATECIRALVHQGLLPDSPAIQALLRQRSLVGSLPSTKDLKEIAERLREAMR
jgi:hypothetical protein